MGYGYDAAGNLTADGSFNYAYDAENRLVTVDAGSTATYTYDGDGRRVQKSGGTLYWYGPGGEVLQETTASGTLLRDFIYFNGQRVARREANNTVYFFFSDHLGSARVVTDAIGSVVEESDFYPFGREIVITDLLQGSQDNPYKFTGQERDPETSLDYFRARHYSFALGRFLQPDEFEGGPVDAFSSNDPLPPGPLPYADITNPQSLNKYAYTYNNPLRYTDPSGHCAECIERSKQMLQLAVDAVVESPTTQGAAQVLFGVAEMALGVAGAASTSATGVGIVGGIALSTSGAIDVATGIATMADSTGHEVPGLNQQTEGTLNTLANPAGLAVGATELATSGSLNVAHDAALAFDALTISQSISGGSAAQKAVAAVQTVRRVNALVEDTEQKEEAKKPDGQ